MLKRLSIRQRILITFLSIVLTGSILQLIIAGRQLQQATLDFYIHQLQTDALMIASTLSDSLEHASEGEERGQLRGYLSNLQSDAQWNYLVMDRNFRIIDFTANTGYEAQQYASQTPELVSAAQGQLGTDIHTANDGGEHLFVAVPVRYEGNILGYLELSHPTRPIYAAIYQQWFELGSTTLPVIVLVIGAGLWLSRTISQPIKQLRNSALKMADGKLSTRIEITTQDEVGELAQTFNYMAEQIERLIQTQRSFVSNAAHELRTPLMTLKLRVEALQDEDLPTSERSKYLKEIQHEVDHMSELVSSLLVLARIDEGRHKYNGVAADTTSMLRDIARHWRIAAAQANLKYEAQIPDNLPELPLTSNDLRLVLDNLLGNAVKYTLDGEICFTVTLEAEQLLIRVRDTGIGFTNKQMSQLFTRFYRSEEARTDFEGTGLGLSIVKSVLDQYGASITANSKGIGQGSEFVVSVPLES